VGADSGAQAIRPAAALTVLTVEGCSLMQSLREIENEASALLNGALLAGILQCFGLVPHAARFRRPPFSALGGLDVVGWGIALGFCVCFGVLAAVCLVHRVRDRRVGGALVAAVLLGACLDVLRQLVATMVHASSL